MLEHTKNDSENKTIMPLGARSAASRKAPRSMNQRSPLRDVLKNCSKHRLCMQCIRTVDLCVGNQAAETAPFRASQSQMNSFAREVFGDHVWEDCQQQRRTEPRNEVRSRLEIWLLRGDEIFGNQERASTCCRLWVEDSGFKTVSVVQRREWTPQSAVRFLVDLEEPSSSRLVLELWARGSSDVWNSLRALCRSGSFERFLLSLRRIVVGCFSPAKKQLIGRIEKRLQDLSLLGAEEWHLLRDSDGADLTSRIQLSVKVRAGGPANTGVLQRIRDHYALSYVFLVHRVENSSESEVSEWTSWLHCVGRDALALLLHHAVQNSIEDVEADYCHLLALMEHRTKVNTQIGFAVMLPLLSELQLQLGGGKSSFVGDALALLVRDLSDCINVQLANLHDQFYLEYERHVMDLYAALSICVLIELTEDVRAVDSARSALRKNEAEWCAVLAETWDADTGLDNVTAALEKIREHHLMANEIFLQAWSETYTDIVIHQLDAFLVKNTRPQIERILADVRAADGKSKVQVVATSIHTFMVVSNLIRELIPLAKMTENIEAKNYREWFGVELIECWFSLASQESDIISGFVAEDDMLPVNANVKYSSSFAQTVNAINENVVDLWLRLDWPLPECASAFAQSVQDWTSLYAVTIQEKVQMQYINNVGTVPVEVCVVINDLTATASYIKDIRSNIIESFAVTSRTLETFNKVDAKLQKAMEEVNASKSRVQDMAIMAVLPGIEQRLESILYAASAVAQEMDQEVMLKQLTGCLTTLRGNLELDAFDAVLRSFWDKLAALLGRVITRLRTWTLLDSTSQSRSYLGMSVAIQRLANSFAIKGSGLSLGEIASDVADRHRQLGLIFQAPDGSGDV